MSKTNSGLVEYAKAQLGLPYWYGTFGNIASASLYASKKKTYPSYYTAGDFASQYGKRVHDCVGLIKGYLWSSSATATPVYNAAQDKSAAGMYSAATTKGAIASFPKKAGQLVFKTSSGKITHVGVYDGNGYVIEAKGHSYGVVKTAFSSGGWVYWAQCPYCEDDTSNTSSSSSATTSTSATTATTAIDKAKSFDSSLAGTYTVTTSTSTLNVRAGAGTDKSVIVAIPKGTKVKNYGYYTAVDKVKWLYVMFSYGGKSYTGFCSGNYLTK